MPGEVTAETLRGFLDAFNRHDLLESCNRKGTRKDSFWKIVE